MSTVVLQRMVCPEAHQTTDRTRAAAAGREMQHGVQALVFDVHALPPQFARGPCHFLLHVVLSFFFVFTLRNVLLGAVADGATLQQRTERTRSQLLPYETFRVVHQVPQRVVLRGGGVVQRRAPSVVHSAKHIDGHRGALNLKLQTLPFLFLQQPLLAQPMVLFTDATLFQFLRAAPQFFQRVFKGQDHVGEQNCVQQMRGHVDRTLVGGKMQGRSSFVVDLMDQIRVATHEFRHPSQITMVARRGQAGELSGVLGRGRCGEAGYFHGDWCGVVGVERRWAVDRSHRYTFEGAEWTPISGLNLRSSYQR